MMNIRLCELLAMAPVAHGGQMSAALQQVEQQWHEQQSAAWHRQDMERRTDPAQRAVETRGQAW